MKLPSGASWPGPAPAGPGRPPRRLCPVNIANRLRRCQPHPLLRDPGSYRSSGPGASGPGGPGRCQPRQLPDQRHADPALCDGTHAYGQYALVISVILFLNNVHASLVTYPLTVRAAPAQVSAPANEPIGPVDRLRPGAHADDRAVDRNDRHSPAFAASLRRRRHAALAGPGDASPGHAVRLQLPDVLPGDAISYLGQAMIVAIVAHHAKGDPMTPEAVFAIVGITSFIAGLLQAWQLEHQGS